MDFYITYFISFTVSGKAEISSAGEQLIRNILTDWNGRSSKKLGEFFIHSKSFMPKKNSAGRATS